MEGEEEFYTLRLITEDFDNTAQAESVRCFSTSLSVEINHG